MARLPLQRITDANDDPVSGGTIEFDLAGTTTSVTVYADTGYSTSLGSSVTGDAAGWASNGGSRLQGVYVAPGSYKLTYKDADGATLWVDDNVAADLLDTDTGILLASQYGAVLDGVTDDTAAIEAMMAAAATLVASKGAASVAFDGDCLLSTGTTTTQVYTTTSGLAAFNTAACVHIPNNIHVDLRGHTVKSDTISLAAFGFIDPENITLENGTLEGPGYATGGARSVFWGTTTADQPLRNVRIDRLRTKNWPGYAFGIQWGVLDGVYLTNLYLEDCGADGIDIKARPNEDNRSDGLVLDNIVVRRHGRRLTGSAGVDIRGTARASNIHVLEFAATSAGTPVGIRLNSALYENSTFSRVGANGASLVNFTIDSGDPSTTGTRGLQILSAFGANVSNGSIRNCRAGIIASTAASGTGETGEYASLSNITVQASWDTAVETNPDYVLLDGIRVLGQREFFRDDAGNLTNGQTVFNTKLPFDTGTVIVRKNGTVQTGGGTDYTVTDSDTITMTSGVITTDVIEIVSPTTLGFDINGDYTMVDRCMTKDCTTDISRQTTTLVGQNWFEGLATLSYFEGGGGALEAKIISDETNQNFEVFSLGTGDVVLRTGTGRVIVCKNAASAVNWLQVTQSATGDPVIIASEGSDTDIDLQLDPSGAGKVQFGYNTSAISGETLARYIVIKDASGTERKVGIVE